MTRIGTVVGWDGSAPADEALEWAADREERRGGGMRILRVLDPGEGDDPRKRVTDARGALEEVVGKLGDRRPGLETEAELVVGDPVTELDRAAGRERVLVLGASAIGRARHADARRIPLALAARLAGTTAIVPADGVRSGEGVLGVVSGRERSRAAIDFAVATALERHEPLTFVRLHDPHDLEVRTPPPFERELERLRARIPELDVRLAPGWVSSPYGLLSRADSASLLVLEGRRPSAAPPRYSLERWLAGQARTPFVVVTDPPPPPPGMSDQTRVKLALAV